MTEQLARIEKFYSSQPISKAEALEKLNKTASISLAVLSLVTAALIASLIYISI